MGPERDRRCPGEPSKLVCGRIQVRTRSLGTILGGGGEYTPRPSLIVVGRGGGTDYKHAHTGVRAAGGTCWLPFFTDGKFAEATRSLQSKCPLPQGLCSHSVVTTPSEEMKVAPS